MCQKLIYQDCQVKKDNTNNLRTPKIHVEL